MTVNRNLRCVYCRSICLRDSFSDAWIAERSLRRQFCESCERMQPPPAGHPDEAAMNALKEWRRGREAKQ